MRGAAAVDVSVAAGEWVDPRLLKPWARNPRRITPEAVDAVAASVQRFGFGAPLVAVRKSRMVVAGHVRLRAALQLELPLVPVRFLDLSLAQAEALAVADNRLQELTPWEDEDLGSILAELRSAGVEAGIGWSPSEIHSILGSGAGDSDGVGDGGLRQIILRWPKGRFAGVVALLDQAAVRYGCGDRSTLVLRLLELHEAS